MRVIHLFIDGIGIGDNNPDKNPFARYAHSFLANLADKAPEIQLPAGWQTIITDAHLGYPGLPQSATGQTSLWTGLNAVKLLERHVSGFPGPTLIRAIQQFSILKQFRECGKTANLVNAYHPRYMDYIKKKPKFISTSTHLQWASGQKLKDMDDLKNGRALYMDITHHLLHKMFPELCEELPLQNAKTRGGDFVRIAREHDLVLFEYFLSDKVGHNMSFEQAGQVIPTLEDFIQGITAEMDIDNELLIISSDHGNLEDLSVKTHTHNPVPTFVYGKNANRLAGTIKDLTDIARVIYEMMEVVDPVANQGEYV